MHTVISVIDWLMIKQSILKLPDCLVTCNPKQHSYIIGLVLGSSSILPKICYPRSSDPLLRGLVWGGSTRNLECGSPRSSTNEKWKLSRLLRGLSLNRPALMTTQFCFGDALALLTDLYIHITSTIYRSIAYTGFQRSFGATRCGLSQYVHPDRAPCALRQKRPCVPFLLGG